MSMDKYRVEPLIKQQAIELAGKFWDHNSRSAKFRRAFPTDQDYLDGRWHQPDGTVRRYIPGWQHHVELARKMLVAMLRQPDGMVPPAMKERISQALIEDNGKSKRFGKKLTQRRERDEHGEQTREVGRVAIGWSGPDPLPAIKSRH